MQFITHGPDIPDALLQAHEDGRVVFFCGAGASDPAGLPGFEGLVEEIYRRNGTALSDIEREAFDRGQVDATLAQPEIAGVETPTPGLAAVRWRRIGKRLEKAANSPGERLLAGRPLR